MEPTAPSNPSGKITIYADPVDLSTVDYIFLSFLVPVGLFLLLIGFKHIRKAFVLCGVVIGFSMARSTMSDYVTNAEVWYPIVGAATGVVLGIICHYVIKLGLFFLGFAAGVLLGDILTVSVLYLISPTYVYAIASVSQVSFGLSWGLFTILVRRKELIVSVISFVGSSLFLRSIGILSKTCSTFDSIKYAAEIAEAASVPVGIRVPTKTYIYFAVVIVLAVIGAWLQFRHTAQNLDYDFTPTNQLIPVRTRRRKGTEMPAADFLTERQESTGSTNYIV